MGKLTALILGLSALAIFTVGVVVVVGWLCVVARRLWGRIRADRSAH